MNAHKNTRIATTIAGTEAGTPDKYTAVPASSSILPPNCDIFLYRHLFQKLESDLLEIFQQKLSHYKRVESDLGRPGMFDWPEAQAKRLHQDAAALKRELDHLAAWRDYVDGLTDFSIESWGWLSEKVLALEEENAVLRARCRSTSRNECTLIAAVGEALDLAGEAQTRLYQLQNGARHEGNI